MKRHKTGSNWETWFQNRDQKHCSMGNTPPNNDDVDIGEVSVGFLESFFPRTFENPWSPHIGKQEGNSSTISKFPIWNTGTWQRGKHGLKLSLSWATTPQKGKHYDIWMTIPVGLTLLFVTSMDLAAIIGITKKIINMSLGLLSRCFHVKKWLLND